MWVLRLVSGLLIIIALAIADDAPNVASEVDSDAIPEVIPGYQGEIPTEEQFLEVLNSMPDLSEKDKEIIKKDLLKYMRKAAPTLEPESTSSVDSSTEAEAIVHTVVLIFFLSFIALIFAFFLYKLFKILTERETKREEKKKMKQMKKKK
ncbi:uncharacterized protein LOC108633012 [Ceratina calcarata]|uniref:Uncharacterized protein LOC108633012 n=1 Tax=Ceratina calcarata TaxID=156304 RepID=A0AAJ7RWV0_9HYME|nr:uncharacterized protein LOC108633012 [Ceratina calcarata]XP_026666757.1 uncharacterized protein LOC108633012 [Ceratina calcarata]XP_026666758.1 uncharacterized protein LOC108633012 [Ceratina calcarata]